MVERFLPADDPILEDVLGWTVERNSKDVRKLLEWVPLARSSRERRALVDRVRELVDELELALEGLEGLR